MKMIAWITFDSVFLKYFFVKDFKRFFLFKINFLNIKKLLF